MYIIGNNGLVGPEKICQSYENNMIEGRKKLDTLERGQSNIEAINDFEFYVHFTDYLTHKEKMYTGSTGKNARLCKTIIILAKLKQVKR